MLKIIKLIIVVLFLLVLTSLTMSGDIPSMEKSSEVIKIADTRGWDITKSGIEQDLIVSVDIINDTTSLVAIDFNNKTKYLDLIKGKIKADAIPITKLAGNITLPSSINFNENNITFFVDYPAFIDGMSFKFGQNSVEVNATMDTDATEGVGRNIYIDIYGCANVAYSSATNDIGFARSCTPSVANSWKATEITAGTFDDFGITGNSSGGLLLYWRDAADVDGYYSTDDGQTWSAAVTLLDHMANPLVEPSCVTDKDGSKYHCCAIDTTGYDVYYSNSTNWNTETLIYDGTTAALSCDIAVGYDNCIYVAVSDKTIDIAVILKSCGGWGSTTIYDDTSIENPISLSIANISGTQSYFAGVRNDTANQFDACFNTAGSWSCKYINSSKEYVGIGAMNKRGDTVVLTSSGTAAGSMSNFSNSSNYGTTWSTNGLNGMSDFPSIADQNFPATAKMDTIAHIVFTNASGVYYNQTTIYELPIVTCNCPASGDWEINDGSICEITTECDIGINIVRISNGRLRVNSNARLRAAGISWCLDTSLCGFSWDINNGGWSVSG